jgi:hypothetical protein
MAQGKKSVTKVETALSATPGPMPSHQLPKLEWALYFQNGILAPDKIKKKR